MDEFELPLLVIGSLVSGFFSLLCVILLDILFLLFVVVVLIGTIVRSQLAFVSGQRGSVNVGVVRIGGVSVPGDVPCGVGSVTSGLGTEIEGKEEAEDE